MEEVVVHPARSNEEEDQGRKIIVLLLESILLFLLETAFDATSLDSEPEDENNDPDVEGVEDAHSMEEDQQGKNNNLFRTFACKNILMNV